VADREALLQRLFPGTNFATLTNHSERIRLVEDTDGDGRADKSTVIADGFNSAVSGPAAGILARRGDVWFANVPELWRISNVDLRMSNAPLSAIASPAPIRNSQFAIRNFEQRCAGIADVRHARLQMHHENQRDQNCASSLSSSG
jgi:hypothetical protein